jgi:hypothetical protein
VIVGSFARGGILAARERAKEGASRRFLNVGVQAGSGVKSEPEPLLQQTQKKFGTRNPQVKWCLGYLLVPRGTAGQPPLITKIIFSINLRVFSPAHLPR